MEEGLLATRMSEGERLANGGKPELVIEFVDNANMTALPQTLNKETITPWGATSVCPDTRSKGVNTDCTNDSSDAATLKQNGDLTTSTENLTTIGSSEWNVPGCSSDWPVMSHDGYHDDDLSSKERREFDSLWGETSRTQKLASENETDGSFVHPSNRARPHVTSGDEGALDPFGQGSDGAFGSGFTDNFCEMSETDLIFSSGLVDEEFKTICVTAEEDDLWSSFTELNNVTTTANQSTDPGSWDPFPANQEIPRAEPEQEMEKVPNLETETDIFENRHELTTDFTKEQVPSDEQCSTDQHFNINQHSGTTAVFKMEETHPPLSANGNVHYDNPSNNVIASVRSPMINLNMSQILEDSAFRETILDESWMAEADCLESKDVTVDLTVQSVGIETEDQTTATEFSSQAILNSQLSKMDHSTSASNDQLASYQELSKLPGDINANVSTNGQQQNILIDFGDSGTSDTKLVVAPPPEFNNGFDSLMDGTEINHTPVAVNSELSNDLVISTNGTSVTDVKEIPRKGTKRERNPSDLERFLNQFGDGTVVDDQATNEKTLIDMDSFLDQLGDGTMIDEKLENGTEHTENDRRSLKEDKGSTINHAEDERQTPSDVDRLLNELGDGTAIDDEETENGHASGGVDGIMNKSAVVGEEVLIRKRTPSDVDRFLKELGDGTMIDEDGDSLMSQEENHLDPSGRRAEDKANEEDVKLDKTQSQEEQSIQDTNKAWEQMVKEGSITMTENLLEESSNVNRLSFHEMDSNIDITATNVAKVETQKPDLDVTMNKKKSVQSSVEGPKSSQASIKQDLNAKRRSFFGEDSDTKNTTFQPVIPDKPGSSGSSIRHSWALPTVPVLPKLQCSYQRPESFYETKPRAATDSLLSSHALLGLGGNQTVSTDTKSRSASEPPPNSAKTVLLTDEPTGSQKDTSSKPKDSSSEAKSTQFIQSLYGHKPGISSEIVEDEKTPFEYELERKHVLAAMKVKRKKRVSWQGSHSDEMTSPDSEDPLSPSPISNSNKLESSSQNWKSQNLGRQEDSGDSETSDLTSKVEPCKPVTYSSKLPPSVTREQMVTNRLDKQGPNFLDQKDTEVLETKTMAYDLKSPLKSPAETLESATSYENPIKKAPFVQSFLQTQESPSTISRTLPNQQGTKTTENWNDSDDGEAPIDLEKMRHLWEEKMTFSPNKAADQSTKPSQPKRVTSYEAKAEEKQVTNGETSEQASADIPKPVPEVASSDPMPRDLDDDYDHCDSFMYEITPHRRIPIRSHWTTESIIQREIKQQTARERELLKEGVIKKRSDQVTVVGDETQVKLQRLESAEKDVDSSESIVNREIRLTKEREDMEAKQQQRIRKISEGRQASIKTSPSKHVEQTATHPMQTKPKVTPVKMAEPEISQQDAQVVESLPPRFMQETAPVVPVVLVDTEDGKSSHNDQATKGNQPRRKDSIVQREIRMQKERDEANARERRKALEETKIRRVSLEGSSRSSSGQSTPIRTPPSPTLQRASFTPIKVSMSTKAPENASTAVKTPDKSPVVRFGLSSMQSEPYSNYREYQRMLRGRKTSERTVERPGPLKATEGNISTTQSPVVFKENNANEPAPQRAPSPLFRRPPSPLLVLPRPPSPQPLHQGPSTPPMVTMEPVLSQDAPDSATDTKIETALQQEIRLAEEREEQLRKQRLASLSRATRKKAVDSDIGINVVIVEKPQVTERSQVTERPQASEEAQSENFSETDGVWRRGRETPVERDIRLAEERELKLRKERGLSPKPTSNLTTNTTAHIETNRPSSPRNVRDQTDSAYNLKTVNYYIKKEFEEERRREVMLKREGKIITVSQCESETSTTKQEEETLSPVKRSQDSETLIEREIRLQQEREEQYKKEKGLKSPTGSIVVQGDGGCSGGAAQGGRGDMDDGGSREDKGAAKTEAPKYRPQRRSLNLAQQWEQMFK